MASVTINLSQSGDAKELDSDNLIHQSQFSDAIRLINSGIKKAIDTATKSSEHTHEAITVLGSRGSGKTTFLLSIKKYIENNEKNDVKVLEIIDPTLIEDKGHVFLNIISIIKDLVDERYNNTNYKVVINQKDWLETVFRLSHGLPSMDGVGGTLGDTEWQDAEFIMEKGLIHVSSARRLSYLFQNFLNEALIILEKKVFLLIFDDIDIDFKKGWSILETIRKYLHTSKIITLVSGDLNLYKLAIRNKYWNNFGKGMMINEGDRLQKNDYFNERISELESQYLLKVVKPERRIHLTTLYEKILVNLSANESDPSDINVQVNNEKKRIEDYYSYILELFGVKNKYQAEAYTTFLLGLPLRTQIQFLTQFGNNFKGLNKANVTDAFLSDLIDNNVNVSLINANPQLINIEILNLLLKRKSLNDLYQLQPVTRDNSLNSCLLSLSFLAAQKINSNPHLIFDYFIKIGYSRNLIGLLGHTDESNKSLNNLSPSIEGLCNYSGIFQNKVLRDIAGNMTAYVKGELTHVNNWAGIISLSGLAETSKKGIDSLGDRIDLVLKNANPEQRIVGFIPLSICSYATINRSVPCYSVFTLLATIGELIRKVEQNDLSKGLAELSEVRSYGIPEFKKRIVDKIEINPYLSEITQNINSISYELSTKIMEWVGEYKEFNFHISPHLLGKISTRFFYALNSIENLEESNRLGIMMHTRVIALLNAILIEDVRESVINIDGFNINNTNLSETILLNNLNNTSNHYTSLNFSKWLISCPLLLMYIDLKPKLLQSLRNFLSLKQDEIHYYQNNSVFPLLQNVTTKVNKKNRVLSGRNDYDNIIESLKERQVTFEWFQLPNDQKLIKEYNVNIRVNLADLFGENASSSKLRNFRKYLRETGKQW
jgi:hypothetical protein